MKTFKSKKDIKIEDDILPEYDLDYSKSRPNKYAKPGTVLMPIDSDIAEVFTKPEDINITLRAIISAVSHSRAFNFGGK